MEIRIKTMDEITDGRVKIEIVADREVVLTGFEGVAGVESCGHTPDVVKVLADQMTREKDRQVSQLIRESRDMASALNDTRAEVERWRDNARQVEHLRLNLERRIEELAGQVEHLTQTLALRDGELVSANEQRDQARNERDAAEAAADAAKVRADDLSREMVNTSQEIISLTDQLGPLKMALVQIRMLVTGEVMDRAVDAAWGHVDAQSMADTIRRTREILNNLPASPE